MKSRLALIYFDGKYSAFYKECRNNEGEFLNGNEQYNFVKMLNAFFKIKKLFWQKVFLQCKSQIILQN